jgi:F0F1-type ATP synthase assembly protein I
MNGGDDIVHSTVETHYSGQDHTTGRNSMAWVITKYLITAAVVVLVSEFAKRSDKLGALIAALPMVTVLTLIWLHVEKQPAAKVANHAWYTFWYVVPTLPMFLVFPALLARLGFWPALGVCVVLTAACFALFALLVRRFGITLM